VSENEAATYDGYDIYAPGNTQWSNRILSALDGVTTPYVFIVLEDYYFTECITINMLAPYIRFMEEAGANKVIFDRVDDSPYIYEEGQ